MSLEGDSKLRAIPPTQRLLAAPGALALRDSLGEAALRTALDEELARVRAAILRGSLEADRSVILATIDRALRERAERGQKRRLRSVINGTGVVLHTNLGRAPLAARVLDEVRDACGGYAALEYDLDAGARGHRDVVVRDALRALTGAEDAIVVNNCAAAVLLACTALASGREVIVSRGELVEIGGGFRVPEVIASCGATLVEVGTTNKTRAHDFKMAISDRTGAILIVHRSNFAIVGFTQRPTRGELASISRAHAVPLIEDLGSGALIDLSTLSLGHEPTAREALDEGSDLVMFSGDKLLGGPQAGILVGRSAYIDRLRSHPLMRALRPGRIVLAALESTLALYASGRALREIPALRALSDELATVEDRAQRLYAAVRELIVGEQSFRVTVERSSARVGGGTLPLAAVPSFAIVVRAEAARSLASIERALRVESEPPIVARLHDDALWLDLRTIADGELAPCARGLARALSKSHAIHERDPRALHDDSASEEP